MNQSDVTNKGWECPKCGKINAPHVNQCDCVKEKIQKNNVYQPTANDGRKILTENFQIMSDNIKKQYKNYTSTISTKVMAISFELATYMWKSINNIKPAKILDLGSGFSSFVFRYYQKYNNPKCKIVSVDTSLEWLDQSRLFLEQNNLSIDNVYIFDQFKKLPHEKYDFILYDLGNMATRAANLEYVLTYSKEDCPVIIDDVHKEPYRNKVNKISNKLNKKIKNIKDKTFDSYGRYSLLVIS